MSDEWIVYDPETGVETFDSEEKALAYAADCIPEYLDEFWDEGVGQIVVAKVTHVCGEKRLHTREDYSPEAWDEMTYGNPEWAWISDYYMVPA